MESIINCIDTVEEYINNLDWRINANSNTGYSHAGLINNIAGKVIANYWLDKVYTKEGAKLHRNGDIHIHDLDCLSGYCAGWSLRQLLDEGFNGVRGRTSSTPPSHFHTALGQIVNFLGILQSEWAGAQAFSSFDTYLAPYVFFDELNYSDLKRFMRSFIYNMNVPSRWGQSPFTNITFDWNVPKDLQNQFPTKNSEHLFTDFENDYLDHGKNKDKYERLLKKLKERDENIEYITDSTYKCFEQEMKMIIKSYYEVMTEGDAISQPFTFPIPTVNITEDFDWDSEIANILFENTAKVGSSYFQNFIGSQYIKDENGNLIENVDAYKPNAVRSMCMTYDTEIDILHVNSLTAGIKSIGFLIEEMDYKKVKIYTPYGYRYIKNIFIYETDTLIKFKTESGLELKLTLDHPSVIWDRDFKELIEFRTEYLKEGMYVKTKNKEKDKIVEIKKIFLDKKIKVYDIEIDNREGEVETHLFYANGILTHNCCRLQLDLRELLKRGNGLFGSAEMTGSIGVMTLNMARLGYLYKNDKKRLFERIKYLCDICKENLEIKRHFVQSLYDKGLYPYTKRYLTSLRNHFSTIGVNGINEMIRNFTNDKENISTDYGINFTLEILDFIRDLLKDYQIQTGNLYNLEATPAEGCTYRFAKSDKKQFPDIIQAGFNENIYYTNSSQLPVYYTSDPIEALSLQDDIQCKYTGGTVFHLYMKEKITSAKVCKKLVKMIIEKFRMPYITITPVFSVCPKHGYLNGVYEYCPKCDLEILKRTN